MPTDDTTQGATPEPEAVKAEEKTTESTIAKVEEKVENAEELAKRLRNKTEEAERLHKKLEKFEAEEVERKKAAMSETERLQLERDEALNKAKELETKQRQRDAAEKVGLPLIFADRLKGATPEELEADATNLLENIPKGKRAPNLSATSPSDVEHGMTDEQRSEFLFGKRR